MNRFILFILNISFLSLLAQEHKISSSSEIKKVTVFLTGAELYHQADLKLKKGKNIVTLYGLSAQLDERSINVEPNSSDVNIMFLNTHLNYIDERKDNDKIKSIKDSVSSYADKLELLRLEQSTLENEKNLLFKNQSIGGQAGVTVLDVEKSADFYRKRCNEINAMIFKNGKTETKLKKIQSQYQKQLAELDGFSNPNSSDIILTLVASKDTEAKINFKYVIPSAGWSPKYDLRTNGAGSPVTLIYRGILFNNSGLDWKDVKITLSTANPNLGITAPHLTKWAMGNELQEVMIDNYNGDNRFKAGKQSAYFEFEQNAQQKNQSVQFKKIEVDAISTEFTIDQTYTIYSDSKPYTIDVLEKTVPAYYVYKAVPSIDKDVFLQAKLALADLPDLVSGEANVYFNGSYIGKTFIRTIDLEDSLDISLGRDKKVQMVRKEMKQEYKRSVVGNYEKETVKYETTIKNTRETAIFVVMEDQVPVPSNSDQSVDVNEISNAKHDKSTGILTWEFTLQPGEIKLIKLGYSSRYPKYMKPKKKKYRTISTPSF